MRDGVYEGLMHWSNLIGRFFGWRSSEAAPENLPQTNESSALRVLQNCNMDEFVDGEFSIEDTHIGLVMRGVTKSLCFTSEEIVLVAEWVAIQTEQGTWERMPGEVLTLTITDSTASDDTDSLCVTSHPFLGEEWTIYRNGRSALPKMDSVPEL